MRDKLPRLPRLIQRENLAGISFKGLLFDQTAKASTIVHLEVIGCCPMPRPELRF